MNWAAISYDWNDIRAFLAVVEHGSLSAAARALAQTQPTLSRQITALEADLGLTLFERGTRVVQLTETGAELLAHVRSMADAATRISRVAAGQSQAIEGTVRLTCSDAMAAYALPRCLIAMRRDHPGIQLEIAPSAEMQDLTRREADIAIRHQRPTQPDLVAKRLPDMQISLFAAPGYLAGLGPRETLADFADDAFIGYVTAARLVPQITALGIAVTERNFGITATTGTALFELARAGAGIALMPVASDVADLQRILPDAPTFPMETWLVTHREISTSRRIRIAFDHLAQTIARDGWSQIG